MTKENGFEGAEEQQIGEFCVRFKLNRLAAHSFNWRADVRRVPAQGTMPKGLGFWNTQSSAESEADARRHFENWRDGTLKRIL